MAIGHHLVAFVVQHVPFLVVLGRQVIHVDVIRLDCVHLVANLGVFAAARRKSQVVWPPVLPWLDRLGW
jgi:hypothetical protein